MIKKIITCLSLICLMCGCTSDVSHNIKDDDKNVFNNVIMTNQTFETDFNKEVYIWEIFIFPTNRIMDRK